MAPDVSVIMPVWRPRRDWLRDAVSSVLGQTNCDLELIVVDDGNDEPIERLLRRAPFTVRTLRIAHGGVSAARNAGMAEARGRFLRFTDADDVLEDNSTARLLQLAGDDVIAYGATMFCDEALRPLWKMESRLKGNVAEDTLLGRFFVRPPSMLFPRAVAERAGPWDVGLRISEDWDWVLRALEHAEVRGERAVATYYRRHATGATSKIDIEEGQVVAQEVVRRWFERHPEQLSSARRRQAEAMLDAMAARVYLTRGRPAAAIPKVVRSLLLDPRAVVHELRSGLPAARAKLRQQRRAGHASFLRDDVSGAEGRHD
ncbi:MAG: glycosyltransferase [Actinomycetota bacterium]|nr:glycosyltransferase [Actinomycetota bacterium]